MHKYRLPFFLATLAFIAVVGFGVSMLARGYRLDPKKLEISPTGILVVTSSPDAAQILINGELETATNATITLSPNIYDVEVKKEGYLSWKKRLEIKREEVTKIDTVLFPAAPNLSALTFSGAISPILSPDGNKIVFGIPENKKNGLWIMDLGNLPIGFSTEARQITNVNIDSAHWFWSADSRHILIVNNNSTFITPATEFTPESNLINLQGSKLALTLKDWLLDEKKRREGNFENLPQELREFFENKTAKTAFSPDGKKVLFIASVDAEIPSNILPQIPGSSTQKEERLVKKDNVYVFDLKEDKNFFVTSQKVYLENANPSYNPVLAPENKITTLAQAVAKLEKLPSKISWFASSNHLVLSEKDKVTIMDYDGTNQQVVFSGSYEAPFAIPSPSTNRLIILTRFGSGGGNTGNLYSLSLK